MVPAAPSGSRTRAEPPSDGELSARCSARREARLGSFTRPEDVWRCIASSSPSLTAPLLRRDVRAARGDPTTLSRGRRFGDGNVFGPPAEDAESSLSDESESESVPDPESESSPDPGSSFTAVTTSLEARYSSKP